MKLCPQRHIQNQVKHLRWSFFHFGQPYFKNILNSTELPLSSIFYTTHPFMKKLTTLKTSGEKSFVNNGTFLFSKFKIMQWKGTINKKKQLPEVLAGLRPATLLKKRLWHRRFPVNFVTFLRKPFLQNTSWQLLLNKEDFLNQHLTSGLVFVLFSFFIISNIMIKNFFKNNRLYFIAKVERKE